MIGDGSLDDYDGRVSGDSFSDELESILSDLHDVDEQYRDDRSAAVAVEIARAKKNLTAAIEARSAEIRREA